LLKNNYRKENKKILLDKNAKKKPEEKGGEKIKK